MTEPKWAPGPWEVDEDYRPGMSWNRHIVYGSDRENRVCFMSHSDGRAPERDRANAHLIAAAPELYEALLHIADEIETDGGVDTSDWLNMAAARAALAKARGEAP